MAIPEFCGNVDEDVLLGHEVFFTGLCSLISQRFTGSSKAMMHYPMKKAERQQLKRESRIAQLSSQPVFPTLTAQQKKPSKPVTMPTFTPMPVLTPVTRPKERAQKNKPSEKKRAAEKKAEKKSAPKTEEPAAKESKPLVATPKAPAMAKEKREKRTKKERKSSKSTPHAAVDTQPEERTRSTPAPTPAPEGSGELMTGELIVPTGHVRKMKKATAGEQLAKLNKQKALIGKMAAGKREAAQHGADMDSALRRLTGAKVHDDATKLKASIKRDGAKKRKNAERWADRKKDVADSMYQKRARGEAHGARKPKDAAGQDEPEGGKQTRAERAKEKKAAATRAFNRKGGKGTASGSRGGFEGQRGPRKILNAKRKH